MLARLLGPVLAMLLFAALPDGAQATVYVNQSAAGSGSSCQDGLPDLAGAISAAPVGETVHVCAGTYAVSGLSFAKSLTIEGDDPGLTILDGGGLGTVLAMTDPAGELNLRDLTVQHGSSAGKGGGVASAGRLNVNRTFFFANSAALAGGAAWAGDRVSVVDSQFGDGTASNKNSSLDGGALAVESGDVTITSSTFARNDADSNAAAVLALAGGIFLYNATLFDNRAAGTGVLRAQGSLELFAVTSYDNSVLGGRPFLVSNADGLIITNSLLDESTANLCEAPTESSGGGNVLSESIGDCADMVGNGGGGHAPTSKVSHASLQLSSLGYQGGPVMMLAIDPTSSAAGAAGVPNRCPDFDQRGLLRPDAVSCDAGAYDTGGTSYRQLLITPSVGGRVTSDIGTQRDCTAFCTNLVRLSRSATLTAVPDAGYIFAGWSGDCGGTQTDCLLPGSVCGGGDLIGACSTPFDQTVSASFHRSYLLRANVDGSGQIIASAGAGLDCTSSCQQSFDASEPLELQARPASGWNFAGWEGDCSGSQPICTLPAETGCPADADRAQVCALANEHSVRARFVSQTQTLTVSVSGPGNVDSDPTGISCPLNCQSAFSGTVTLVAQAQPGAHLQEWSGACAGAADASCTVTMDQARQVGATFAADPPALTLRVRGPRGTVRVGKRFSVQLTVINSGGATRQGSACLKLPPGSALVRATRPFTVKRRSICWTLGSIVGVQRRQVVLRALGGARTLRLAASARAESQEGQATSQTAMATVKLRRARPRPKPPTG